MWSRRSFPAVGVDPRVICALQCTPIRTTAVAIIIVEFMGTSKQVLVRAAGLRCEFDGHAAVDGLDLTVHRGEVLGLLGPNGAGKSTTLRLLTGTLAPTSGSIEICGTDLVERPLEAKRHIGYLPERPPLYPELTVDEYLSHCARLRRLRGGEIQRAVAEAKQRCGLMDCGRRIVGNLSLGYRQRVGIAQAIVHRPDVVILDEPTIGLDPVQMLEVRELLRQLALDGALILSSHILPEVESVCTHVQILHRGRGVQTAPIAALTADASAECWARVAMRDLPAPETLLAIEGIEEVTPLDGGACRVRCANWPATAGRLVDAAHDGAWGLLELTPERRALEQVFLSLVLDS